MFPWLQLYRLEGSFAPGKKTKQIYAYLPMLCQGRVGNADGVFYYVFFFSFGVGIHNVLPHSVN